MLKYKTQRTMLLLFLSSAAIALDASAKEMDEGFTLGLDYGRAEARKYCDNIQHCDNADNSAKGEVGFQFNKNLALEVGYTGFGTLFNSNDNSFMASQKSNALTASVIGTLPFTNWFGVYGRVGAARYKTDCSGTVEGVSVHDRNGTSPFFGAGVKFNLTNNFDIRAEYQVFSDISRVDGKKDDVQGLYAGVLFRI